MNTTRRIQRDSSHEEFVKSLTSGEKLIFKEIWRLLLFAAAIGVRDGVRKPLGSVDSGKAMPETYFSAPGWRGFLYLIGIADTGDSKCLQSTEEEQNALITAFEEYANRGLVVLKERLITSASPLDDLATFLLEVTRPPVAEAVVNDLI